MGFEAGKLFVVENYLEAVGGVEFCESIVLAM